MKRFLLLSGLHFAAFVVLLLFSLDFSAVDGGEPALVARIAGFAFVIVGQPGIAVHEALGNRGDLVEWAIVVGNSLLWGALLAAAWGWRRARAQEP